MMDSSSERTYASRVDPEEEEEEEEEAYPTKDIGAPRDLEKHHQHHGRDEFADEQLDATEQDSYHGELPLSLSDSPSLPPKRPRRGLLGLTVILVALAIWVTVEASQAKTTNIAKSSSSSTTYDSSSSASSAVVGGGGGDEQTPQGTTTVGQPSESTNVVDLHEAKEGCVFSDHFDNENGSKNNKLYPGQFICSKNKAHRGAENHRYRFGLTKHGDLILEDTLVPPSETYQYDRVLYLNPNANAATHGEDQSYYFSLQTDGTFVIHSGDGDGDQPQWTLSPKHEMQLSQQCIQDHDCPYLHMNQGGALVINYLDQNNQHQHDNALKVYKFDATGN